MPYVGTQAMLLDAQRGGYAVAAFNIENMEMAQAVVAAAEGLGAPVILQTTPGTVRYGGIKLYSGMVRSLAKESSVPVSLHLDHGNSFDMAVQAIASGYSSIMIDGSGECYEENIELSRRVVAVAHPNGIPVEAELGKIGGKEDDSEQSESAYTDPNQAADFVEKTGISSLAVAIGTAHGIYDALPVLRIDILREIRAATKAPLVLHGSSGLSDTDISACIAAGACKVNFATELRIAYSDGVKKAFAEQNDCWDPKAYGAVGREHVRMLATQRMKLCLGK